MPASEKQIEANRRNAEQSTGPKSDLGKLRSSKNAIKHAWPTANGASPALATSKLLAIFRKRSFLDTRRRVRGERAKLQAQIPEVGLRHGLLR